MIDQNARQALVMKQVSQSIEKLSQTLMNSPAVAKEAPKTPADSLITELKALQKVIGPGNLTDSFASLIKSLDSFEIKEDSLKELKALVADLSNKVKILTELEVKLPKNIEMNFPKEFPVKGKVESEINKLPPVVVSNLSEVNKKLEELISGLQLALYKAVGGLKLEVPSSTAIKGSVEVKDWAELIEGIEELKKGFNLLLNKEAPPVQVEIPNIRQLVPQPVTKFDINALRGEFTTTGVTVGTTLTKLPGSSLAKRRGIIVFNNDATKTLYVGGANITTSGSTIGLPVLPQSYSPSFDAGPTMILYGIVATGSVQAITLELSNDYSQSSTSTGNV